MTTSPDEKPPPAPLRERGYSVNDPIGGITSWWDSTSTERAPELRWPFSLEIFDRMTAQDAQVSSVLRAVTTPIERTGWRIDGTGCREDITAHVAADLGLPIVGKGNTVAAVRSRGRFSWQGHLAVALEDYLTYGHAIFEQIYTMDAAGMVHLRKLGYRPPRSLAKFNVARDGGLVSVEQYGDPTGTTKTITLPVNRLVAYVHGRKGGNWVGRSLLRPAYKNWIIKDRLLRVQAQVIERNGMGIPVYGGAEGEEDLRKGLEIASSVRAGDDAGTAIPYGATLKLQGVDGRVPDAKEAIEYHDNQIARAVLAHFLNLGSQTGSWALGSTFADFFTLSLQAVAEEIRNVATQHIIEDLVDINWGRNEPAPRLVFDEIGSRRDAVLGAVATLVTANVLHPDEDLEQFVRTALGLPPRDPNAPPAAIPQQEAS